jgi:hypothetical protein
VPRRDSARRQIQGMGGCQPATELPRLHCASSIREMGRTSHNPCKPADQHFRRPSTGKDLHASVSRRPPLEGRIAIAREAVQVREVGCRHGENLSVFVHSPPKEFGPPRGRCDVEPPGIAVAADEKIEYRSLRRHHGDRSIGAASFRWRRGGSTCCNRVAGRVGRHQGERRKAPREAAPQGLLLPRRLRHRGRRGCPPRHALLSRASERPGTRRRPKGATEALRYDRSGRGRAEFPCGPARRVARDGPRRENCRVVISRARLRHR